jgi:hypothetical protein
MTHNITDRLDRLERENRQIRKTAALLVLVIFAAMLSGQSSPPDASKGIEAQQFTVKDANGTARASWGINSTGAVVLGFMDADGKARLTLSVEPDGSPVLYLYGRDQTRRFLLHLNHDLPELVLFNSQQKRRVSLMVDAKQGSGGLLVSDNEEKRRGSFFVGDDGSVAMTLLDENENLQIGLGRSKQGPLLSMNDLKGNARIILGSLAQGPALQLYDDKGGLIRAIP